MNTATDTTFAAYDLMMSEAAFDKLEKCHTALLDWRAKSHADRAPYLRAIATTLRDHADVVAILMTEETGKLLRDGLTEVELCAQIFEYMAENGPEILADEDRTRSGGEKRGVLASNLMAGNGVILKHVSICTGSGLMSRDICHEADLPKVLFDVLIVDHDTSDAIIEHKLVRSVTMTGSDAGGRHIAQVATKNLMKPVLELGSNDAYLILKDADIELAVKTCVQGRLCNNGETCVSAKRFIVTGAFYDAFTSAFVDQMKAIRLGDPQDEDTQLGPLSSAEQFDTICEQVTKSVEGGAEILCGGTAPNRAGQYYHATMLANCQAGTPAYDDEIFGPVVAIIKAKDDVDAMRIANDSRYGLGGGIFSKDEDKAMKLTHDHFDTGMIRINSFGTADPNMPFGEVKSSDYGREHGSFGMKEFVNAKAI